MNQGRCDIYDLEKRKLLYTYISVDTTNYLAIDPQNRFDGTEKARKMLYYTCGNEIIDLDQVKDLSWEPGLVEKIMGTDIQIAKIDCPAFQCLISFDRGQGKSETRSLFKSESSGLLGHCVAKRHVFLPLASLEKTKCRHLSGHGHDFTLVQWRHTELRHTV